MQRNLLARVVFLLCVLGFQWGCRNKLSECNALIAVANEQEAVMVNELRGLGDSPSPERIDQLAGVFDGAGKKIGGVALKDTKLTTLRDQYTTAIARFVAHARSMAQSLRNNDTEGYNQKIGEIQRIDQESEAIVQQVNDYCQK